MNAAKPGGVPDSAVNPAWRDVVLYAIIGAAWADGISEEEIAETYSTVTDDWMERFREVTPGSGGYLNEGDVMEPNFGQAFYGYNYDRLVSIKKSVDPWGVFWAPTAVGSEDWYITGQPDWIVQQTGRLCPK